MQENFTGIHTQWHIIHFWLILGSVPLHYHNNQDLHLQKSTVQQKSDNIGWWIIVCSFQTFLKQDTWPLAVQ